MLLRRINDEDDRLMGRVAAGDRAAFALLMDRHVDQAFRLAHRILRNSADAEDAVQEAFLRVWTNAAKWRPGRAKFSTWLWRVVVNLCLDARRRPVHGPLDETDEPADPGIGAEALLEAAATTREVNEAVASLPERQRAAIALVYDAGTSNQEAADALWISVGALEQLLVRAKRTLRTALAERTEQ